MPVARRLQFASAASLTRPGQRRAVAAQCVPEARTKLKRNTELLKAGDDSNHGGTWAPAVAYNEVHCQTNTGTSVHDITADVNSFLATLRRPCGTLTVTSQHTTTAITVNEFEPRLVEDVRLWLARQAPPHAMYLHNDLDQRPAPEAWTGTWEEWAAQEPRNAHSHLAAMLTGNSESIPVVDGALQLGTWQSVLLVELDGPRQRSVGLQFTGLTAST